MPATSSCFSNPADLPPVIGNRDVVQSAQCGWLACFSYPADVPPGPRQMHTNTACFKYPADVPPGPRRMHTGSTCFRY
jgi:hypothetical protein